MKKLRLKIGENWKIISEKEKYIVGNARDTITILGIKMKIRNDKFREQSPRSRTRVRDTRR